MEFEDGDLFYSVMGNVEGKVSNFRSAGCIHSELYDINEWDEYDVNAVYFDGTIEIPI